MFTVKKNLAHIESMFRLKVHLLKTIRLHGKKHVYYTISLITSIFYCLLILAPSVDGSKVQATHFLLTNWLKRFRQLIYLDSKIRYHSLVTVNWQQRLRVYRDLDKLSDILATHHLTYWSQSFLQCVKLKIKESCFKARTV